MRQVRPGRPRLEAWTRQRWRSWPLVWLAALLMWWRCSPV